MKIGDLVIYINEKRQSYNALVTAVWDGSSGHSDATMTKPSLNLIYVSPNESEDDTYGRQIKRDCSVVHIDNQPAKASCWKSM